MFEHLLESSYGDDSNKWSNIGFGEEITQFYHVDATTECSRPRSRIVRDVIDHSIRTAYKSHNSVIPRDCPFYGERDVFHIHEAHKSEESYGKWYCNICGKSFYAESFLDEHLSNRHPDQLYTAPDAVCLSDFCDVFRCDFVFGRSEANFWDTALCIEDDMADMIAKCNKLFSNCVPQDVPRDIGLKILNKTKAAVCGSLTCNRYWYSSKINSSEWRVLLKTFMTVTMVGFMIVYYFLAYHHFYTESFYDGPQRRTFKPYNTDPRQQKVYSPLKPRHKYSDYDLGPRVKRKRYKRYIE